MHIKRFTQEMLKRTQTPFLLASNTCQLLNTWASLCIWTQQFMEAITLTGQFIFYTNAEGIKGLNTI